MYVGDLHSNGWRFAAIEEAGGVKPRDWHLNLWELDLENPENNGLQNAIRYYVSPQRT